MPNQSANCHCVIASADFVASSRGIGLKQVLRVMDDKMLITTIPGSSLRSLSLSLITMISPNGLITFALSSSFLHFLALCHQAKQQDGSTKLQIQRKPSYYWAGRQLECVNHGLNISRCSLKEEGRVSELNPGCFDETDTMNQTRVYCRLNCEESDETTVLRKEPSNNHICTAYHTYNLERRRRDWYLWRVGNCTTTTITFHLRCGFPSDPRVFYAQNKHLYEYEYEDVNEGETARIKP